MPLNKDSKSVATFAGGCFWGVEEIFRKLPGVLETTVGYTGGTTENPTYKLVCTGTTGHAEALEIVFDPQKITYEKLVFVFFKMHDPTTKNRQKNDIGTQYRSAIFVQNQDQKDVALKVIADFEKRGEFKDPIVTEVVKAGHFYPAEQEHQDYLIHNPDGYNCHILRD